MDDPDERGMNRWPQERLLRAAHGGDDEAFETFCVRVLPGLTRYLEVQCRKQGVPVDLALDFAHDTLTKAIDHINTFTVDGVYAAPAVSVGWLNQIGYHLIVDWSRKRDRQVKAQAAIARSRPDPNTREQQEQNEEILKFVGWLKNDEREMIELVFIKGLHVLEAGKQMGLTVSNSYKVHERAMTHLSEFMEEHSAFAEEFSRR